MRAIPMLATTVLLVVAAASGANALSYYFFRHRLDPLYAVAGGVKKGMDKAAVLRLMEAHKAEFVMRSELPNGDLHLWVSYSLADSCETIFHFVDNRLLQTRTIGEDNATDFCPGAPADVE